MNSKALEKRLDSLEWAFSLERELEEYIGEVLTFPDGAEILARLLAEAEARYGECAGMTGETGGPHALH